MTVTVPLPTGFQVVLDAATRSCTDDAWFGGTPARITRLTETGLLAWRELCAGPVASHTGGLLARRLTDAGLAHPVPPRLHRRPDVTVVIPVRDRADLLDQCLTAQGDRYPVIVVDDGSRDPDAVAAVADAHRATLLRRSNGGPGPARDTALPEVTSEFVAFLDSDCVPAPGWIDRLAAHFADPLIAAVAPRVTGDAPPTWAGRYARANGVLDLGDRQALVRPGSPVSYLPTAALLIRRTALPPAPVFDPALRHGEDVDLIWRLNKAGWRIRYVPDVPVAHQEPAGWVARLHRRFRYGTSAAPLARRHPSAAPPLTTWPEPILTVAALLAGRPGPAVLGFTACVHTARRGLRETGLPPELEMRGALTALGKTWLGFGRYGVQFAAPALVLLAVLGGQTPVRRWTRRCTATALLLSPALAAWTTHRDTLDPVRFMLSQISDDLAYGLGVLTGCARERTVIPLRPVLLRRRSKGAHRG